MILLRWLWWPLLLLPAFWWAWQQLHAAPAALQLEDGARLEWVDCWFEKPWWRPMHCARYYTAPEPGATRDGPSLAMPASPMSDASAFDSGSVPRIITTPW